MRAVLITGVSGFIGGATARALLRAQTYDEVWGLARHDPGIPGLKFIAADITQPQTLPRDFRGDIVHAAGAAADGWDERIDLINRQGTANMLALNAGGVFIHISSSSVYDLSKPSHELPEDAFSADAYPFYNTYGESKARAELLVQAAAQKRAIAPVILRPHAVYGPGDNHLLPRVEARIKRGRLFLPDAGRAPHSFTHITNLVRAILATLTLTPDTCEAYNVTDAAPMSIAGAIELSLPNPPRIRGIGTDKLLFLSGFVPGISEYELRQVGFERTYDISKARNAFGYDPTIFTLPLPGQV